MAEKVKVVNGHIIKAMTRDEIDKELRAKGDWGIEYYVPGRIFYPYFITVNRERFRFEKIEQVEKVCKSYTKDTLKQMTSSQIYKAIEKVIGIRVNIG